MLDLGFISQDEWKSSLKLPLRLAPVSKGANRAPYFVDFVRAEMIRLLHGRMSENEILQAGFRVFTTLDLRLQRLAEQAVREGVELLEKKLPESKLALRLEGALASVDHRVGAIRTLIGGRDYQTSSFNRILNMRRQVGSTFKPIVYLSAYLSGVDTDGRPYFPGRLIADSPWTLTYDRGRQTWSPKNYEPSSCAE
jgi:membrane carboxypeptidase/penicillin-binding protein